MKKSLLLSSIVFGVLVMTACEVPDLPPPDNGGSGGSPTPAPSSTPTPTPSASPVTLGNFKKVFIVVLENTDDTDAMKQPFMGSLAKQGVYFSNFVATTHPSQPNYIAMTAGSTHGVSSNSSKDLDVRSIVNLLEEKGKSWKSYADGYPGNCFKGNKGKYVRKHEPFISYKFVQNDPARCAKIVNSSELAKDVAQGTIADYSFFVPDQDNDGHDTSVAFADTWLKNTFGSLIKDPRFMKDMLFIVTFDENDGAPSTNKIYTAFYGDSVIPGMVVSTKQDFYTLLRTLEDSWGLGNLGQNDATAKPITGIWR